ncbi:hypothetical protein [Moraxella boevrei]|uniref:hypothetical protein n=1 Tax=Faucicola boevrei TaxID=346665 RepID=UPI00373687A2
MTFNELKNYYKGLSSRKIAKEIGVAPSQMTYYKKVGIPLGRQVLISEKTNGKLKASSADREKRHETQQPNHCASS